MHFGNATHNISAISSRGQSYSSGCDQKTLTKPLKRAWDLSHTICVSIWWHKGALLWKYSNPEHTQADVMRYGNYRCNFNTLKPRQNGRRFPDDIFKCIFSNENVWISIKISLKFVPKGPIDNFPALVQIMAWRRPGDKPWSEPMMISLLTHICVTRPQWVN